MSNEPFYSKPFGDKLLKACVDYRAQVDQLERENAALRSKLELLCDTIDAHEIESQSCDRDGYIYCDCLRNNAKLARAAIDAARKEQP